MGRRVERTRNLGTWTEAMYFGRIRSVLRTIWMREWEPRKQAIENAKRPYKGSDKRRKWEYQCGVTKEWFRLNEVEVHHLEEAGSLNNEDDLVSFIRRLLCEDVNKLMVISKAEHKKITNNEKKNK